MKHFGETIEALRQLDQDQLDHLLVTVRECSGTIWVCGNGGSHSTAQHWACDLTKAAGQRAVALGSNPALLTAYANDIAYNDALTEEIRALLHPGDMLICLSCSGISPNIIAVLGAAWHQGITTALLTGDRMRGLPPADVEVHIASSDYGVIEDCHLAIGHWLTKAVRT